MKLSSMIILVLLVLYVTCIFASNIMLMKQYEKVDKNDTYWNFSKIEERPFKHVKITGGNFCRIIYEPGVRSSVRILNYWHEYLERRVKTDVKNDTLFLDITDRSTQEGDSYWLRSQVLIRIFSPQLLSIHAFNANLELSKLKQKTIHISLAGKSELEVESYISSFDTLYVTQKDTSKVVFEMSPELHVSGTMQLKVLDAHIQGYSILDVGHFQIQSLQTNLEDTSAIIFSGGTLKAIRK